MEIIRAAVSADLPELHKLVNAIFIDEGSNSARMEEKFPIFLSKKNLDHLFILTDSGRPIAHAGYYPSTLLIEGAGIRVGSIGSVCTHPDYRGQRIASQILDVLEDKASREGIELLLISGDRSLYLRRQCIQTGGFIECWLESKKLDRTWLNAGIELVEAGPAHLDELVALYSRESVRFYRTKDEFEALFAAGIRPFYHLTNKAYLARSGNATRAYFTLSSRDDMGEVTELAGDRDILRSALFQVMQKENLEQIRLPLPQGDELVTLLHGPGVTQQPSLQLGTVKILNPLALFKSLRPYFLQRLSASLLESVQFSVQDGIPYLEADGDRFTFTDSTWLTRLVFGFEKPGDIPQPLAAFLASHPHASQFTAAAFPVPLPWAGNLSFI